MGEKVRHAGGQQHAVHDAHTVHGGCTVCPRAPHAHTIFFVNRNALRMQKLTAVTLITFCHVRMCGSE